MEISLSFIAHRFQAGSKIRLAISEGLWPLVWPSPRTPTLTLSLADCALVLPVRSPPASEAAFPIPLEAAMPGGLADGPAVKITRGAGGAIAFDAAWPVSTGTVAGVGTVHTSAGPDAALSIVEGAPASCLWRVTQSARFQRGDWDCGVESLVELRSTPTDFVLVEKLTARRDGRVVFEREHPETIRRDLM